MTIAKKSGLLFPARRRRQSSRDVRRSCTFLRIAPLSLTCLLGIGCSSSDSELDVGLDSATTTSLESGDISNTSSEGGTTGSNSSSSASSSSTGDESSGQATSDSTSASDSASVTATVTTESSDGDSEAETSTAESNDSAESDATSTGSTSSTDSTAGDEESGEETSESSSDDGSVLPDGCEIPEYEDDIVLDKGSALRFTYPVQYIAHQGSMALACGRNELGLVDLAANSLAEFEVDSGSTIDCAGVAWLSDKRAIVAWTDGTMRLVALASNSQKIEIVDQTIWNAIDESSRIYDISWHTERGYIAGGIAGVASFQVSKDRIELHTISAGTQDARSAVAFGEDILVADAFHGLKLIDHEGKILDQHFGFGITHKILVFGDRAVVLRGGYGIDLMERKGREFRILSSGFPSGFSIDGKFVGDEVLVASGSALNRFRIRGEQLEFVSRERRHQAGELRGTWYRGVAGDSELLHVLSDQELIPLKLGHRKKQPDITIEFPSKTLWAKVGSEVQGRRITLANDGTAPLVLQDVTTSLPFTGEIDLKNLELRPGCPEQYVLRPGKIFDVLVGFKPDSEEAVQKKLVVQSSDPDEPLLELLLEGNRATPPLDAPAPEFRLLNADRSSFYLPDYRGKVVLLRLFNLL